MAAAAAAAAAAATSGADTSPRSPLANTLQEAQTRTGDAVTLTGRRLANALSAGDLGAVETAGQDFAVTLLRVTEVVATQLCDSVVVSAGQCAGVRRPGVAPPPSVAGGVAARASAPLQPPPPPPPEASTPPEVTQPAPPSTSEEPSVAAGEASTAASTLAALTESLEGAAAAVPDMVNALTCAVHEMIMSESDDHMVPEQVRAWRLGRVLRMRARATPVRGPTATLRSRAPFLRAAIS
jgi:hypothetical protein